MPLFSIRFLLKRNINLRNVLLVLIFLLIYCFLYNKTETFRNNKIETSITQRSEIAVIYIEDTTECLLAQFIKHLVYALKKLENFNSAYSLHVFTLQRTNQSQRCNFSEAFVTNVCIANQTSFEITENLAKFINRNSFSSVIILHKFEDTLQPWPLGDKLSSNINIYYILHSTLIHPNIETIGLVRHMGNHARHLIVMSWYDYHTLIHTYGIDEHKILYIPHGVPIPTRLITNKTFKSSPILSKYTDKDFLLLSTDTIYQQEDVQRLLVFKLMSDNIPNLHVLIISRSSIMNNSIMPNFFDTIKSLQLENRITWINKSMSSDELDIVYKRANAYISLSNKTILNPGLILNAMAYALPIISIPDILAMEFLKPDRGLIVPFDDSTLIAELIIKFFKDPMLMNRTVVNAQEFVQNLTWTHIAKQYTVLFKTRLFTNADTRKSFISTLIHDPYENASVLIDINNSTYGTNRGAISFDQQNIVSHLAKDKTPRGIYTLYVDPFLQFNARINDRYQIEMIGLKTAHQYVIVNRYEGIDEFKITKQENFTNPFQIDYIEEKIIYRSMNIHFEITRSREEMALYFLRINRFINPFGLIGATLRQKLFSNRNPIIQPIQPGKWLITDRDIFSHSAEGQRLLNNNGIEYNLFILPKTMVLEYLQSNSKKIRFIMEGSYIDGSSAHCVNRRMFLSIVENDQFFLWIDTSEKLLPEHDVGLETYIMYSLYLRQNSYLKLYQNTVLQQLTAYKDKTIIFRGGWPLNINKVSNNDILIQQEPIEFFGVPKLWVNHLKNEAHELWIPSQSNKDAFRINGVPENKIHVIPHGVFTEKYQRKLQTLKLPTKKTFKFLSVGGMLGRKGYDLLFEAYLNTFSYKDDVTLIIHALYSDGTAQAAEKKLKTNSSAPEILSLGYYFTEMDLIRLFRTVDVYVSSYRGEGFGLTILEAMATGLPPIVTKYGPAVEFCPEDCGYFIETKEVECRVGPCGNMTLFGEPTAAQPRWAAPSIQSLSEQMRLAYTDRVQLKKRSEICRKAAEQFTWEKTADKIFKRIAEITN